MRGLIMKSEPADADVVIVGGGFSGTMIAAQLSNRGLRVALVEGGERAGQGTAYSTRDAVHLLNVPAAKMSAWPDRPDDFVGAGHEAGSFAPRREYGVYLRSILNGALAGGVQLIEAKAVSAANQGGWSVTLDDRRILRARALVLAQGNQPPEPMRDGAGVDGALFVNNPWGSGAREAIERVTADDGAVLVLGTGLTMIDMLLSLEAAGHRGRIVALSRRGQVPRSHAPHDAAPVGYEELPKGNVMALWGWLRARSAAVGWRAGVDSLRPHAQALWRGWSVEEQHRFLRHARPYWDVHRHRIAPQVAAQLEAARSAGRLEVVAGRLRSVTADRGALAVSYSRRNAPSGGLSQERFGAVFNCTGPLGSMARTRDPLLRQMIEGGIVAIDHLGMGISVDGQSRAAKGVWALGPLSKGAFWEIVAVPDIRGQVASVADQIAKELKA